MRTMWLEGTRPRLAKPVPPAVMPCGNMNFWAQSRHESVGGNAQNKQPQCSPRRSALPQFPERPQVNAKAALVGNWCDDDHILRDVFPIVWRYQIAGDGSCKTAPHA